MAYIGPSIETGFRQRYVYTATAGQTSFSGNDSVGISLTYTDSEYLDVYQNGVLLVPGSDYAATTGTTVVLVTGASLNDKVEMIAYQAFGVADTVSRADGGAFGGSISTSGTLTATGGIVSPVTINGTTPTLTIGDAGAEDAKIVFDGNAVDYHVGLDDSTDLLTIGKGSALGTTAHMTFSADGEILKPLQPAFLVFPSSNTTNIAINTNLTVAFATEVFDVGANFASNTFTAPITGKYLLAYSFYLEDLDIDTQFYQPLLVTSNRTYYNVISNNFSADLEYLVMNQTVVADMDAGDTAHITIQIPNNGAAQLDIFGDGSYFSGALIC